MKRAVLVAFFVLLSLALTERAQAGATQPSFPIKTAFYYPSFPQTWTVNGSHVFYQPSLGYYDSSDQAVQRITSTP